MLSLYSMAMLSLHAETSTEALVPDNPNCFELAALGNHFIAMGEEGAVAEITRIWDAARVRPPAEGAAWNKMKFTQYEIGWICRLIFISKQEVALRPPLYGALSFLPPSFSSKDWPFSPLAESGGVFFLLSGGYALAGHAEDPLDYLAYCRANGRIRNELLLIPTEEQASQALDRIVNSDAWKKAKWKDSGQGFSYELDPRYTTEYLKPQIKKRANHSSEPTRSAVN